MANPIVAAVGGGVSSLLGARSQARAADRASDAQLRAAELGIEEQRRQFDEVRALLQPYVESGTGALEAQMALIGLGGPEAQQAAIDQLEASPGFTSVVDQGENAILQNAAATGGLRGGNTQRALAEFRPAALAAAIDDQFADLGSLTGIGQASAAGQAAAAQATGNNISNLLQQQGAAQAGAALARGQAWSNAFGGVAGAGGWLASQLPSRPPDAGLFSPWGFGSSTPGAGGGF